MSSGNDSPAKSTDDDSARVDVWLWSVRLFKSRTLAGEACKKGRVEVNGQRVKPARQVREGDEIMVKKGPLVRTVAVRETLTRRVGAKEVPTYLEDRTPEEAWEKAAEIRRRNREGIPDREEGSGRPTKKDRRDLEEVMAEAEEREALLRKLARTMKTSLLVFGIFLFGAGSAIAADPPKRSFQASEKSVVFKIAENLSVSAEKLQPETNETTGVMTGLSASGSVIIKTKPKGASDWIIVACDKATYQSEGDVIVLTGWPAVKSGLQILRSTAPETYVRVERASGKWAIKGPHRIDLNFGK